MGHISKSKLSCLTPVPKDEVVDVEYRPISLESIVFRPTIITQPDYNTDVVKCNSVKVIIVCDDKLLV